VQRVNLGHALCQLGGYAEAERALRSMREVAKKLGLPFVHAIAGVNLGLALACQGSLEEACAIEREVIANATDHRNTRVRVGARMYLAIAHCLANQFSEAEREAQAAFDEASQFPPLRGFSLAARARAELGLRKRRESLASAQEAMDILSQAGTVEGGEGLLRLTYAEAHFAVGETARAQGLIRIARDRLLVRAELITDPAWRGSFLRRVPEHAATFARAAEWRGPGDGE
jgi:eukaryotic-like serine/threonine-protein kinase